MKIKQLKPKIYLNLNSNAVQNIIISILFISTIITMIVIVNA